jgi:hypothetical protein
LSIATLCVSLRNIVLEFEAADEKIRTILVSGETNGPEIIIVIQTERDNRKEKLTELLNEVYQARNVGQEKKMPEWKKASDVFKNITQGFKAKSEPKIEQMEKTIVELTSSLDISKSELKHWSEETCKNLIRIKVLEDENRSLLAKTNREKNATTNSINIREKEIFLDTGFKLDAKTPCFKSGSGEDVETWLDKIETALETTSRTTVILWNICTSLDCFRIKFSLVTCRKRTDTCVLCRFYNQGLEPKYL